METLSPARTHAQSAAERDQELYGATALGRWVLAHSQLKGTARRIALTLAHEYQFVNETGDNTATLYVRRSDLAEFAGVSESSVRGANKILAESGEWEVIPGAGQTQTAYRPSQLVVSALASKKGE